MAAILLLRQLRVKEAKLRWWIGRCHRCGSWEMARLMGFVRMAGSCGAGAPDAGVLTKDAAHYYSGLAAELEAAGDRAWAEEWRSKAYVLVDKWSEWDRRYKQLTEREQELRKKSNLNDLKAQVILSQVSKQRSDMVEEMTAAGDTRQALQLWPEWTYGVHAHQAAKFWFQKIGENEGIDSRRQFEKMKGILEGRVSGEEVMLAAPVDKLLSNVPMASFYMTFLIEALHAAHRDDLVFDVLKQWEEKTRDPSVWSWMGDFGWKGAGRRRRWRGISARRCLI